MRRSDARSVELSHSSARERCVELVVLCWPSSLCCDGVAGALEVLQMSSMHFCQMHCSWRRLLSTTLSSQQRLRNSRCPLKRRLFHFPLLLLLLLPVELSKKAVVRCRLRQTTGRHRVCSLKTFEMSKRYAFKRRPDSKRQNVHFSSNP